jgi:hypothetical protein
VVLKQAEPARHRSLVAVFLSKQSEQCQRAGAELTRYIEVIYSRENGVSRDTDHNKEPELQMTELQLWPHQTFVFDLYCCPRSFLLPPSRQISGFSVKKSCKLVSPGPNSINVQPSSSLFDLHVQEGICS